MRQFFVQLGWEFYKLAARPRTWFAFVAAVVFEDAAWMAVGWLGFRRRDFKS